MKKLTKQDILDGANRRETFFVKEYNAEVTVRPLTDGEITRIFSLVGPVQIPEGDGSQQDIGEQQTDMQKNFEALRLATCMGLTEPQLSSEEVSKMKFGVPEEIGSHILEISGVIMSTDQVKKKRKEIRDLVTSNEGAELSTLCVDLGYKLASSPSDLTRDQINFLLEALNRRVRNMVSYAEPVENGVTRIVFQQEEDVENQ